MVRFFEMNCKVSISKRTEKRKAYSEEHNMISWTGVLDVVHFGHVVPQHFKHWICLSL
jgi:hypothetical protein